ncbi:transcriptional regulator CynR [Mycobacterium sp. M1]|uniref:Transcriptional regulator CynR n=1 Tax=Mycolicibacter acidiphilus TaxID=2835306 RepID=A0ABS5RK19_9MYCO|nr:transcriptional regulator CynR [Mycolicibacter acidiphilus]MBS9533284.1 transcriptional regulator CynR [Mycolicibacter acidiphilus]
MELRHLHYLLAVAEHGNFTRAAEDLHLSQPTLSQQIRQLERFVGLPLLDRSGRTVRLTDAGEVYARHGRRMLSELAAAEHAVQDVTDLSRGHLRLAVTPTFTTYLVGPLIADMHTRHPGISFDLTETTQDRIEVQLLADEIDLGIAFAPARLPGLDVTALYAETLSLVVAAGGSPTDRPIPVQDLARRDVALLTVDFATRGHIDAYLLDNQVRPRTVFEANSAQAVIEIVQRTALGTILPDAITHDHHGLDRIALEPALTRTVMLMRRDGAYHSSASQAFTELTTEWVRARGYPAP